MDLQGVSLDNLTEAEKAEVLRILGDISNGDNSSYNKLLYDDYKEMPVDIITFIKDYRYLGKAWHLADGTCKLFPFWEKQMIELFPDEFSTNYNNFIESGARGLGKSEIAITVGLYMMHRLMCLKNPHEFLNLKPTEKVAFAFMNITKILAEEIGIAKFQATVQMSPWFMERGTMTQKNNEPYWNPPDFINMIIGSQASHVIGQPIYFCLDGGTPIITDKGVFHIEELEGENIKVYTISDNNEILLSDECTVKQTAESLDEYQIELEDGSIIKCTPNHRFMLKDGTYKEAQYLTTDDELYDVKNIDNFGYIYKFTMVPTNKIYVGKREKSKFDESYYGSGREWKKDLFKYGKESVKREILCWGSSREDLNKKEIYWISKLNANDSSIGYNIHKGGAGGYHWRYINED